MTKVDAISVISKLINSGRLTYEGKVHYEYVKDVLILSTKPERVVVVNSLRHVHAIVDFRLQKSSRPMAYLTGGLEVGQQHVLLLHGLELDCGVNGVILGVEDAPYVLGKGREPVFSTENKLLLWRYLVPDNSVIFVVPEKPQHLSGDVFYDWLSEQVGVYKNSRILFAGSNDDPEEIMAARRRRAYSDNHIIEAAIMHPILHTSDILV